MKWKIVLLTGCVLIALGGVAKATGVVGGGSAEEQSLSDRYEELAARVSMSQTDVTGLTDSGQKGPRGRRGPKGARGPAGPKGATGATGAKGATGATGATGPKGATGATGPKGAFSSITSVKGPTAFLSPFPEPGAVGTSTATCPAGSTDIGGGWGGGGILETVGINAPSGTNGWTVIMTNNNESNSISFYAIAVCATP